jgi:hypothetical protein
MSQINDSNVYSHPHVSTTVFSARQQQDWLSLFLKVSNNSLEVPLFMSRRRISTRDWSAIENH